MVTVANTSSQESKMKSLTAAKPLVAEKSYRFEVQIVSNPDFHQYFRPMKAVIFGETLADLKARAMQFIEESYTGVSSDIPIGGGNWGHKTMVYTPEGKVLGRMSYNGRLWDKNDNEVII
jgi:hypothetical protein